MGRCCFIGHRKIERTPALENRVRELVTSLITKNGVCEFLFGSRSQFDDLCHEVVTALQGEYPNIKRIAYTVKSEYAVKKEAKQSLEKAFSEVSKRKIKVKAYEGESISERILSAGKASYVERNQDMIDGSEYCVFYYDPDYLPPTRKRSSKDLGEYQPKSGTALAFAYAQQRKKVVFNLFEG